MTVNYNTNKIPKEEADRYVEYAKDLYGDRLENLDIVLDGEDVLLTCTLKKVEFDRIRRITGYLTGTLDKWNDAKRAEEKERVKHGV